MDEWRSKQQTVQCVSQFAVLYLEIPRWAAGFGCGNQGETGRGEPTTTNGPQRIRRSKKETFFFGDKLFSFSFYVAKMSSGEEKEKTKLFALLPHTEYVLYACSAYSFYLLLSIIYEPKELLPQIRRAWNDTVPSFSKQRLYFKTRNSQIMLLTDLAWKRFCILSGGEKVFIQKRLVRCSTSSIKNDVHIGKQEKTA